MLKYLYDRFERSVFGDVQTLNIAFLHLPFCRRVSASFGSFSTVYGRYDGRHRGNRDFGVDGLQVESRGSARLLMILGGTVFPALHGGFRFFLDSLELVLQHLAQ